MFKALEIKADYIAFGDALGGRRYEKVIVFLPQRNAVSDLEWKSMLKWVSEVLPTKLGVEYAGELYLI